MVALSGTVVHINWGGLVLLICCGLPTLFWFVIGLLWAAGNGDRAMGMK